MPSSMTHTYFGMDVIEKLKLSTKKKIDPSIEEFKTFCQGPDVFYFYHLFCGKEAKEVFGIGSTVHKKDTRKFFVTLIHTIFDKHLENNSDVMSFLYGYMCHYFLDSVCHPFIYYKTGKFDKKDISTYKYNALHADMEFFIDRYLIYQREHIEPSKYKIHKQFLNVHSLSDNLRGVMRDCFGIYDIDKKIDDIYLSSITDMRMFFRIFNYDCFGLKKELYSFIDFVTPKWVTKVKSLSYRGDYEKKVTLLNLNHETWNHPCDKKLTYTYSFMDLYDMAMKKCVEAINKVDEMFDKGIIIDKELNIIFKNLSYLTGMDCDSKLEMKYFEF